MKVVVHGFIGRWVYSPSGRSREQRRPVVVRKLFKAKTDAAMLLEVAAMVTDLKERSIRPRRVLIEVLDR